MKSMKIGIFDYSAGNLGSLKSACHRIGFDDVIVTSDFSTLEEADCIILPGVGSFGHCIESLNESGDASSFFKNFLKREGKSLVGICIGMHVLGDVSDESDGYPGLGLIPGCVRKLKVNGDQKLPHVGWNSLDQIPFDLKTPNSIVDVYFDHSYKLVCDPDFVVSSAFHGEEIPAVVKEGNIVGLQFHPELSGKIGLDLLKQIVLGKLNC